jgi:hypothetical protein
MSRLPRPTTKNSNINCFRNTVCFFVVSSGSLHTPLGLACPITLNRMRDSGKDSGVVCIFFTLFHRRPTLLLLPLFHHHLLKLRMPAKKAKTNKKVNLGAVSAELEEFTLLETINDNLETDHICQNLDELLIQFVMAMQEWTDHYEILTQELKTVLYRGFSPFFLSSFRVSTPYSYSSPSLLLGSFRSRTSEDRNRSSGDHFFSI